jgi:hypothetical protein
MLQGTRKITYSRQEEIAMKVATWWKQKSTLEENAHEQLIIS